MREGAADPSRAADDDRHRDPADEYQYRQTAPDGASQVRTAQHGIADTNTGLPRDAQRHGREE